MSKQYKTQQNGSRQNGFTLIELVVVIVILGILSAFAIAKYADFKGDANIAVINGFYGSLKSTVAIAQAKAAVQGVVDGTIDFEGESIEVLGGAPKAHWDSTFAKLWGLDFGGFTNVNVVCNEDLCGIGNQSSLPGGAGGDGPLNVIIWPKGFQASDRCYAWYHNGYETGGDSKVSFGLETQGCK